VEDIKSNKQTNYWVQYRAVADIHGVQ